MQILAIIGLGNPGPKFKHTRHNIGFQVLDAFAEQYGANWRSVNSNLELAEINAAGQNILLLKPQTFMNSSGQVLPYLLKKGIKAENILVVHDELEQAFGQVKPRQGGSARGHNGLKSIISVIGPDFWRLRIGISRPEHSSDVPDYVLQNFKESAAEVAEVVGRAVDQINGLLPA
jgi:PTH1 family peptidyl-tRNA hydrolase